VAHRFQEEESETLQTSFRNVVELFGSFRVSRVESCVKEKAQHRGRAKSSRNLDGGKQVSSFLLGGRFQ